MREREKGRERRKKKEAAQHSSAMVERESFLRLSLYSGRER